MVKKVIQQGHSPFDARSVLSVREHGKRARTPLGAFFNIPIMAIGTIQQTKAHFAQLIQRALAGEEIIVAKGKKPVARIVPIPAFPKERTLGSGKGIVKYISSDFDESLEVFPDVES